MTKGDDQRTAATSEELGRWAYEGAELGAQRIARERISTISLFPDLMNELAGVFGFTPARDYVHQIIYWMRRPGMRNRWVMYVTAEQMKRERNMGRKPLVRGRKQAVNSGVTEEKLGPYKRIHTRLDWVRLEDLMPSSAPLRAHKTRDEAASSTDPLRAQKDSPLKGAESIAPPSSDSVNGRTPHRNAGNGHREGAKTTDTAGRTNTEDYARDYSSNYRREDRRKQIHSIDDALAQLPENTVAELRRVAGWVLAGEMKREHLEQALADRLLGLEGEDPTRVADLFLEDLRRARGTGEVAV